MSEAVVALRRIGYNEQEGLAHAQDVLAPADEWAPMAWLVGAHGGAGVTTLAHTLAPFGDAGQTWPVMDENPWCVVVARATREGVEAAHNAVLQAQAAKAGHCRVVGVMLVEAAPDFMPETVEQKITVLRKVVPNIWHVPFVEEWAAALRDELPLWSPLNEETPAEPEPGRKARVRLPKKKPKGPHPLEEVPQPIKTIGYDLVDRVREANRFI